MPRRNHRRRPRLKRHRPRARPQQDRAAAAQRTARQRAMGRPPAALTDRRLAAEAMDRLPRMLMLQLRMPGIPQPPMRAVRPLQLAHIQIPRLAHVQAPQQGDIWAAPPRLERMVRLEAVVRPDHPSTVGLPVTAALRPMQDRWVITYGQRTAISRAGQEAVRCGPAPMAELPTFTMPGAEWISITD